MKKYWEFQDLTKRDKKMLSKELKSTESGLDKQIDEIEQVVWEEFTIESNPYDNPIWVRKATKRISQAVQESRQSLLEEIKKEVEELKTYYLKVKEDGTSEMSEEPNCAYIHILEVLNILNSKGTE